MFASIAIPFRDRLCQKCPPIGMCAWKRGRVRYMQLVVLIRFVASSGGGEFKLN